MNLIKVLSFFSRSPSLVNLRLLIASSAHLLSHVSPRIILLVNRERVHLTAAFRHVSKVCWFATGYLIVCHSASASWVPTNYATHRASVNWLSANKPLDLSRSDFSCPDFTAVLVPPTTVHAGAYLACENWDQYVELMRAGNEPAARKLLLTEPTNNLKP